MINTSMTLYAVHTNADASATGARETGAGAGAGWVLRGLIVRVIDKAANGGAWFRKKGTVVKVDSKSESESKDAGEAKAPDPVVIVELQAGAGQARLLQSGVQTLLARPGGAVRVVRGVWAGARGTVHAVSENGAQIDVAVASADATGSAGAGAGGKVLRGLGVDDVCKRDVAWETEREEAKRQRLKKKEKHLGRAKRPRME